MSAVGTKKLFEDDKLIVWEFELGPGEEGELHTHELDYVVRVNSGSVLEVYDAKEELLYKVETNPGDTTKFALKGDLIVPDGPERCPIPRTHRVRNVGPIPFSEVLIEFKK